MLRCKASDAPELYRLAEQIAQLTNPQLFMDLREMAEAERRAEVETLKSQMEELMH
jgi:hypothetical protein